VTTFKKALVEVGEFVPDNIFLMTDKSKGEKRPTNTNILFSVESLARLMKPQDTFIFYFSGHGMMRDGKAFLLSINADKRSVRTLKLSGVPMDELRASMSKIKARQVLFIVDACRNDPDAGKGDEDNLLTDDFARNVRAMPGSDNSGFPSATATLYSCSKGERAYEYHDKKQGVFSYFLVKGLRGEAVDSDGNITFNSLADYTQKEVTKWARARNKKQTPWPILEGRARIVLLETEISPIAWLEISSHPAGAAIYIDEIFYGKTAKSVEIDLGIHKTKKVEVALVLDGYKSKIKPMALQRGKRSKWTNVKLSRIDRQKPIEPKPDQSQSIDQSTDLRPTKYRQKDSMKMVYIPAGTFMMGDETGDLNGTESWLNIPQHEVYVDAFYMDEHEVTNAQYCKFLNAIKPPGFAYIEVLDSSGKVLIMLLGNRCKIRKNGKSYSVEPGYEAHPIVSVYWHGANEYAKWVGGRLPTEAEWERAARGGVDGQKYPNGNSISHDDANYKGIGGRDEWEQTAPVKSFDTNAYGLYDMAGNVYEWCSDYWDAYYYSESSKKNPAGPSSGSSYVVRGGSWYNDSSHVRSGFRSYVYYGSDYRYLIGFRVVASGFSK